MGGFQSNKALLSCFAEQKQRLGSTALLVESTPSYSSTFAGSRKNALDYYGDSLLNTPEMPSCAYGRITPSCYSRPPHHVIQRGNRREQTLFEEDDYALYKYLLSEAAQKARAKIWCYCLMPNHVHVIIVPSDEDGLRRTFADAHQRYTGYFNARIRIRVTGHLWQGRFGSMVMDEEHLANAVRYVSLNPVRTKLVERAQREQGVRLEWHFLKDISLINQLYTHFFHANIFTSAVGNDLKTLQI